MTMTHKYLNTDFKSGVSVFTDLDNPKLNNAVFTAQAINATVGTSKVPMVRGSLAVRVNSDATVCGNDCPVEITESVKIEFNVDRGAARLSALRAEVDRLFADAVSQYGFTAGHVPPPQASFVAE